MATIHIEEIQSYLKQKGFKDAEPHVSNGEGYFIEIKFDKQNNNPIIDEEFQNKVITADCFYGTVTIVFDKYGQLYSLDLS